MKGLLIASKGAESIAAQEIKELIKAKSEIKESAVIFPIKKFEDLCVLCYRSQSAIYVLNLLETFKIKKLEDIKEKVSKLNLSDWLSKDKTFRVLCERIGQHDFNSQQVEAKTGEYIIESIKKSKKYSQKVSLGNPDVIIFVYICDEDCYIGIDFAGFDLSKRDYKIFSHPTSLKGNIAYSLVRIAELKKEEKVLDPFTGSGTIPIEAALFLTNYPVRYYSKDKFAFLKFKQLKINFDKLFEKEDKKISKEKTSITASDYLQRNIKAAEKNAKIAGIQKSIDFTRQDIEWLDTKFKENELNKIITDPPSPSKMVDIKEIEKVYRDFFYNAEHILKKKGIITLLSRKEEESNLLKKFAEEFNFKLLNTKELQLTNQKSEILIFENQKIKKK